MDTDAKGNVTSFGLPISDAFYNGKPSIITEINWSSPNRYRADMPVVAAAYGSLQGTNGFYFFATGEPQWSQRIDKFAIHTPAGMGQFPATALMYRKGMVRTGQTVVDAQVKLADLFALEGARFTAAQNLDELRAKDVPAGRAAATATDSIDPLACLVGRVKLNISEKGGQSKATALAKYIDRQAKTVRSGTGELAWDYGRGLVTVDTPQAQGATGFLSKAGAIRLGAISIQSGMEYGSVVVVSLDDRPLKTSRKMLVQVMSEEQNNGWSAPGTGKRAIADAGGAPVVVRNLGGTVSMEREDAEQLRVRALNFNGYERKDAETKTGKHIELAQDVMYYVVGE